MNEDQGCLFDSLLEERFEARYELDEDFEDEDFEEEDVLFCPICGGHGVALGTLGTRRHFRCQECGIDYSEQDEDED